MRDGGPPKGVIRSLQTDYHGVDFIKKMVEGEGTYSKVIISNPFQANGPFL